MALWPSPTSTARSLVAARDVQRAPREGHAEGSAGLPRRTRRTRRLWLIALAFGAVAIAGATAAAADGLLQFRDPGPNELTFPNEITCRQGTTLCTPGRSPDGQAFRLFTIGTSGQDVHVVGAGVDTGNGKQVTPLVCTRPGSDLQCGTQPPVGEKQLGMYVPN